MPTNALVSAGACAFALSAFRIQGDVTARGRLVSYVISGIGFLVAGVIFKEDANVRGLNTAATIWCSAAIGLLTGLGAPSYAAILASSVLIVNVALRPISNWLDDHSPEATSSQTSSDSKD